VINRRRAGLAGALLCAATAVAVYIITRPDDEARIRRLFAALEQCLRREPGNGAASLVLNTQRIAGLFAESCEFRVTSYGLEETLSPTEISSELARAHAMLDSLSVSFRGLGVAVLSPTEATATCSIDARASRDGERIADAAAVTCRLVKRDGRWHFRAFAEEPVLEK